MAYSVTTAHGDPNMRTMRRSGHGATGAYHTNMPWHERIVVDFRGGPRGGSRKDLGDSSNGRWPAAYDIPKWPLTGGDPTASGGASGHYVRTDEWTTGAEARIYLWQPAARPES